MRMNFMAIMLVAAGLSNAIYAAEAGGTENTVTIGMSLPLSGINSAYGAEMKDVITNYFDLINKGGGVNGRKLNLIALDDGYEPSRAVANSKKLIDDHKVFALIQYFGSDSTIQAMDNVFGPAKVPLVGAVSGADNLRTPINGGNTRYMFNVRASYRDETKSIVNQLVTGMSFKRIAIFYQNDGFGKSGLDGAVSALKKHNLQPVAVDSVERNSLDVNPAVTAISKANPQAVVMVTLYKPTAAFVKAMRQTGQNPQFIATSPVGAEQLVKELGPGARGIGISQVIPYPFSDNLTIIRDYHKLLQHTKTAGVSYYGFEAYISARLMVDGIKNTGKNLTSEKFIKTLESMTNYDLGGYRINFTPNDHNGSNFVELSIIGSGGRVLR